VVAGLFDLFDSGGLPLTDIMHLCRGEHFMPCWTSFVEEARNHGWKEKTIRLRLQEAVSDSFGFDFWIVVQKRLNLFEED